MLLAARQAARQGFDKDRHLPPHSEEAAKQIHYVQDVARVLRENVVQGRAVEGDPNTYKLRIHEHTELGDNDSIKTAKGAKLNRSMCS